MDCKLAELLMMQHFEKTIEHGDAKKLAEHVLECEFCRELYLVFDQSIEYVETAELYEKPPADFTESVMSMVRGLPAHSEPAAAASTNAGSGPVVLRVLWGISAIILGVGILLVSFAAEHPLMDGVMNGLTTAGTTIAGAFEWIVQDASLMASGYLSVTALFFVGMLGALLYILHNDGEKSIET
ncbi:MAG: hypothetical protein FWB91_03480 [Defluviitaleaceae bacterium]|nr:hypothetical protein [Defluviitaleaceae bacterium]